MYSQAKSLKARQEEMEKLKLQEKQAESQRVQPSGMLSIPDKKQQQDKPANQQQTPTPSDAEESKEEQISKQALENLENAKNKNNSLIKNLMNKQKQGEPPQKPKTREEAKERAKQLIEEEKEPDSNTALKVGVAFGAVALAYLLYNRYSKK